MFFRQVYDRGLAQASYMIGCQASGTALVVDAKRDIDTYIEIARQERLVITHLAETHVHADFLAGTRELAMATGAEMLLSAEGGPDWRYAFAHTELRDGSVFKVGNITIEAVHTPGHTPEHLSFVIEDTPAGGFPMMILTGDFVFVGDVGRPDLLEKAAGITGTQEAGAHDLFRSLKRFRELPEYVQVWPGHGAGSACGKALGAVPSSTVGFEMKTNWGLRETDEAKFTRMLLDGQPEPPAYFGTMKAMNKSDRPLLDALPAPRQLTAEDVSRALDQDLAVIDTRDRDSFSRAHIPGTISIPDVNAFSTWAGWILDYKTPILLIADPDQVDYFVRALVRIGLDQIHGYLPGFEPWLESGRSVSSVETISPEALHETQGDGDMEIVDVRGKSEYMSGHIHGAVNIHAGEILKRSGDLTEGKKLVLQCAAGDRAVIAYSLLARIGRIDMVTLAGGIDAWKAAMLEVDAAA